MAVGTWLKFMLMASIIFHLMISPYTKVEESFNIQAIHDILNYGVWPNHLDNFDHQQFPGVVPRTFIGSLVIAGITLPLIKLLSWFGINLIHGDQLPLQFLVRLIIGFINGVMMIKLSSDINKIDFIAKRLKRSSILGNCFLFLMITQFHILYYASRTLPNFMALPLVNYAFSKLLKGDMSGLTWLAFVGIVFRIEVGVFGGIVALVSSFVFGQSDIFINILMLVAGTLSGAALSFTVDSYFWGYYVIPELASLKYNVFEGQASNWGVEPFNAYFTNYLPKIFKPAIVLYLSVLGCKSDPSTTGGEQDAKVNRLSKNSLRILFTSALGYIFVMSFQGHKELRFIIYSIPIITLLAANALANFIRWPQRSFLTKALVFVIIAISLFANIVSITLGFISSFNYPGGDAVRYVNEYANNSTKELVIHLDVATCMTGATRFGELHNDLITYDKTENPQQLSTIWNDIDILVTSTKIENYGNEDTKNWEQLTSISAFKGYSVYPIIKLIQTYNSPQKLLTFTKELILNAYTAKDLSEIKSLLESPIIKSEFIFIYKRLNKTEFLNIDEPSHLNKESVDEVVDEPNFKEIEQEINEEIDKFEKN